MILEAFARINWVDIVIVIIFARTCYIALKNGLPHELFRFLGTVCAIYFSLHYYTPVSDFFRDRFDLKVVPLDFLDFIFFVFIVVITDLFFFASRSVFARFIKMEAVPRVNKIGGVTLGAFRSILLSGLIVFMLVISSISYLRSSALNSLSGSSFLKVAPSTYSWLWRHVMSKFMAGERFNETIQEVQDSINS
ncbi:MAG: CvpA family protein [Candidatus Omnitrophota bacterium]